MKDCSILKRISGWLPIRMADIKRCGMKALALFPLMSSTVTAGYAQEIDNFDVGPYEVDYYREGDFVARLRQGVDLYKFFELERDTIINIIPEIFEYGVQVNVDMGVLGLIMNSNFNTFGLSGSWKQQIDEKVYYNIGISLGYSTGKYNNDNAYNPYTRKDAMLEIGVPISVELTNLYGNYNRASLYGAIGITPAFYSTMSVDESFAEGIKNSGEKDFGFLLSPRVDFGGYIPVSNQKLRIGIYGEYRICCFQSIGIYKKRVSRSLLGVTTGLVF